MAIEIAGHLLKFVTFLNKFNKIKSRAFWHGLRTEQSCSNFEHALFCAFTLSRCFETANPIR